MDGETIRPPIPNLRTHLDELCLCLCEAPLVFEEHGVLEVHVGELVLGAGARKRNGQGKGAALCGVVDGLWRDEREGGDHIGGEGQKSL